MKAASFLQLRRVWMGWRLLQTPSLISTRCRLTSDFQWKVKREREREGGKLMRAIKPAG